MRPRRAACPSWLPPPRRGRAACRVQVPGRARGSRPDRRPAARARPPSRPRCGVSHRPHPRRIIPPHRSPRGAGPGAGGRGSCGACVRSGADRRGVPRCRRGSGTHWTGGKGRTRGAPGRPGRRPVHRGRSPHRRGRVASRIRRRICRIARPYRCSSHPPLLYRFQPLGPTVRRSIVSTYPSTTAACQSGPRMAKGATGASRRASTPPARHLRESENAPLTIDSIHYTILASN